MGRQRSARATARQSNDIEAAISNVLRNAGTLDSGGIQGAVQSGLGTQEIKQAAIEAGNAYDIIRGDDEVLDSVAYQGDGITPLDLTGATIWCTGKIDPADIDANALWQKTNGTGGAITITDALNGVFETVIVPADTDALTAETTVFFDIQVRTSAGKVHTVDWGAITVNTAWDITRANA